MMELCGAIKNGDVSLKLPTQKGVHNPSCKNKVISKYVFTFDAFIFIVSMCCYNKKYVNVSPFYFEKKHMTRHTKTT